MQCLTCHSCIFSNYPNELCRIHSLVTLLSLVFTREHSPKIGQSTVSTHSLSCLHQCSSSSTETSHSPSSTSGVTFTVTRISHWPSLRGT